MMVGSRYWTHGASRGTTPALFLQRAKETTKLHTFQPFLNSASPFLHLTHHLVVPQPTGKMGVRGSGCRGRGWGLSTGPQTISKHERHRTIEFLIRRLLLPLSGAESGVRATESLSLDPPAGSIWSGFTCEDQSAVMTSSPSKCQISFCIYLFFKKGLWLASLFSLWVHSR